MKRKESNKAILCNPYSGPAFYDDESCGADLYISNNCNNNNSNYIKNDGTRGYKCHPKYKMSLFVNSNDPDKQNNFYVSDYEVFTRY